MQLYMYTTGIRTYSWPYTPKHFEQQTQCTRTVCWCPYTYHIHTVTLIPLYTPHYEQASKVHMDSTMVSIYTIDTYTCTLNLTHLYTLNTMKRRKQWPWTVCWCPCTPQTLIHKVNLISLYTWGQQSVVSQCKHMIKQTCNINCLKH